MLFKDRIITDPGKRGGRPCVRGTRITVYDILSYFASGMSFDNILEDFPELTREDILASLEYLAEHEPIQRSWCASHLPCEQASDTALLSEAALAVDWDRPDEDEAWRHLQ